MENPQSKMLLAALSQCVADRDKAFANVAYILKYGNIDANLTPLRIKEEFDKISQAEITIDAIQVYYANHFNSPKTESDANDNNS